MVSREVVMADALRGSCLCGRVVYEIRHAPKAMYHCHCGMCRKANGSSLATNAVVLSEEFALVAGREGLSSFESSPGKRRYFCARCGSPIYSHSERTPQIVSVRCGTLDAAPSVRPSRHIHTASKAPWFEICDGLPQSPEAG
jgi:hypothetical protein